jgi:hypothetical protein
MGVFPPSGGTINGGATNAVYSHAVGSNLTYITYDGTNWVTMVAASTTVLHGHASMFDSANSTAFTVNAQTDKHCYHVAGLQAGDEDEMTFDAGGAGTSFPIASIADGADSGVDIEVTTTGSHLLAVDDIISQTALTSAVYTGIFKVKAIISATAYEVAAVYTATDTGTMDQAATLIFGLSGDYYANWWASAAAETSAHIFNYALYLDTVAIAGSKTQRKYGTGGDIGSFSGGSILFSATAGQRVSWVIDNESGTGDITAANLCVRVVSFQD